MKSIANHTDCTCLQNELDSLCNWSSTNIALNKEKTVLLRFCANHCPIPANYFLDNQQLVPSECHRDLGVVISNDLSWSAHYIKIVSKTYKDSGFDPLVPLPQQRLENPLPLTSKITADLLLYDLETPFIKRCFSPGVCPEACY